MAGTDFFFFFSVVAYGKKIFEIQVPPVTNSVLERIILHISRFHCTVGQLVFASFEKGRYPCYPWDFFLKVVHFFSLSEATLHLVIY